MAPASPLVDPANKAQNSPTGAHEIVCIRLGPFSLLQGEALWQHGDQACIRHLGKEIVGPRVASKQPG